MLRDFDRHYPDRPYGNSDRRGGGHRGGGFDMHSLLDGKPDAQILFVGALACTRHRNDQLSDLMRKGRLAFLCPSAADFSTGHYLQQIIDATVELSQERHSRQFVLMYGCQCAVLSTDFDLIKQQLRDEHGIELTIHERCHLRRTDEDWEREEIKRGKDC